LSTSVRRRDARIRGKYAGAGSAAKPGQGYAEKASDWRGKIDTIANEPRESTVPVSSEKAGG